MSTTTKRMTATQKLEKLLLFGEIHTNVTLKEWKSEKIAAFIQHQEWIKKNTQGGNDELFDALRISREYFEAEEKEAEQQFAKGYYRFEYKCKREIPVGHNLYRMPEFESINQYSKSLKGFINTLFIALPEIINIQL